MYRLLSVFAFIFIFCIVSAQKRKENTSEPPKLIVGIVVEDMRYDYLFRFWDNFSDKGFKRLVEEGNLCQNANYNYMLTQTAPGFATIASGTVPFVHGIIADRWYQRLQNLNHLSVFDIKTKTVGTDNDIYPYAPKNLLTSTFTDELKMFNNNQSKVFGVSFKPEAAIFAVGHLADGAYWFDDISGNWITSSYYCDSLPKWVNSFNNKHLPDIYIERDWIPILADEFYRQGAIKGLSNQVGFRSETPLSKKMSSFLKKDSQYSLLKATPFGVLLTKDFAIATILEENLGGDEFTDFIGIGFSSPALVSQNCGPNSKELEDVYIRLDRELEYFLNFIDEEFGKQNVLVYLTSDHGTAYRPSYLKDNKIPAGEFDSGRAIMLLGTYLNAIYGKGEWVAYYSNKQVFLNRKLIEDSKLKLSDVQNVVSEFIIQFSGVANAVTSTTLENTSFDTGVFAKMQNSFNQKYSGDIIINLEPGWIEKGKYLTTANSSNSYDTHVPLIWYGWKIKRGTLQQNIYIEDIAPTISNFLNIPFPNGCTGKIIEGLK